MLGISIWNQVYQQTPPVGFMLREKYGNQWLRIHSLPNAKRYAETSDELRVLLERHERVASAVLGCSGIVLFVGVYGDSDKVAQSARDWSKDLEFRIAANYDVSDDDEPYYLNIYEASFDWSLKHFDQIVLDVADENAGSVVFFSPMLGNAYAPYDGGADIFLKDERMVGDLREQFVDLISRRADGL